MDRLQPTIRAHSMFVGICVSSLLCSGALAVMFAPHATASTRKIIPLIEAAVFETAASIPLYAVCSIRGSLIWRLFQAPAAVLLFFAMFPVAVPVAWVTCMLVLAVLPGSGYADADADADFGMLILVTPLGLCCGPAWGWLVLRRTVLRRS